MFLNASCEERQSFKAMQETHFMTTNKLVNLTWADMYTWTILKLYVNHNLKTVVINIHSIDGGCVLN